MRLTHDILKGHDVLVSDLTPHLPKIASDETTRQYAGPGTSRVWTPIDNYNESWFERFMMRQKTGCGADFERENKVSGSRSTSTRSCLS